MTRRCISRSPGIYLRHDAVKTSDLGASGVSESCCDLLCRRHSKFVGMRAKAPLQDLEGGMERNAQLFRSHGTAFAPKRPKSLHR